MPRYLSPSSFSVLFCVVMPELLSGTGQQGREVGAGGVQKDGTALQRKLKRMYAVEFKKKKGGREGPIGCVLS